MEYDVFGPFGIRQRVFFWSSDSEPISFGDKICFKYKWATNSTNGATKKTRGPLLSMKYWLVNRDLYNGSL